jgi:PKD repeat protein
MKACARWRFAILMLASAAILTPSVMATLATEAEMEQAARNWLTFSVAQHGSWAGSVQPLIVAFEDITLDGTHLGRVFFVEPNGYVVVPVLREMPPVKFYSDEAWLDIAAEHGSVAMYRDLLQDRAERFISFYGSLDAVQTPGEPSLFGDEHLRQWDWFTLSERAFADHLPALIAAPLDTVGPLLTTNWHQGAPYNNLCPMGDGGRSVVGCVATGLAQIMTYHQWPPEGAGTRSYYWPGDNSCGGSSEGSIQFANFNDPYDWDNMPDDCDDGCTPQQQSAVAELCYEVGVMVDMAYGHCESGAYPNLAISRMPQYLKYKPTMHMYQRVVGSHTFEYIRTELNNNRPVLYVIFSHAIVCDGCRSGTFQEYHMNYGWADNHNKWYVVDELHCPWDGCSPSVEYAIAGIEPDKKAVVTAENTVGWAPLDVQFYGYSDLWVDFWNWSFGDGGTSTEQNPLHTYETPGVFDVTMTVNSGGTYHSRTEKDFVICIADTLWGEEVSAPPGGPLELVVCANNHVPLEKIRVPITMPQADFILPPPDSFSISGCRTEHVATAQHLHWDGFFRRYTFQIVADEVDGIAPGNGPILKVYFTVPASAGDGDQVSFDFGGYTTMGGTEYQPLFDGSLASYEAACNGCVATVSSALDVDEPVISPIPTDYSLEQNYPNPFNPATRIDFALPRAGHVTLRVLNILGERVATLVDRELAVGEHFAEWDGYSDAGQAVASGMYLYRLEVDGQTRGTRKMMLLK